MSEDRNKLRIHTRITPEQPQSASARKTVRWRSIPHPQQRRKSAPREKEKLTLSDRLLRNSALACALLLAVLALGNINQPWARSISESVEQALTMRIDLDESIGSLSFVRDLMPESALVFLNLSGETELARPVNGNLTHSYSDAQPWLMFECAVGSEAFAVTEGTVTAVTELSGGTYGILVDHGGGLESVYAYLSESVVQSGDSVQRGQTVGLTESSFYFELRDGENTIDPSAQMGL